MVNGGDRCGIMTCEVNKLATRIRAHYDGKTFVPDEPVDLPVDQPVEVELLSSDEKAKEIERKLAALQRIASRAVNANIPDEALRRENMYEDRL